MAQTATADRGYAATAFTSLMIVMSFPRCAARQDAALSREKLSNRLSRTKGFLEIRPGASPTITIGQPERRPRTRCGSGSLPGDRSCGSQGVCLQLIPGTVCHPLKNFTESHRFRSVIRGEPLPAWEDDTVGDTA